MTDALTSVTRTAAPCRYCGRDAYARDGDGPLHPCCWHWRDVIAVSGRCPACAVSRELAAVRGRRRGRSS